MQRYGGVSRYFFELASRLPSNPVSEVAVVAPVYINNYLSVDSARRFTYGRHLPFDFKGARHAVALINRLAAPLAWSNMDADVVHETFYSMNSIGKGHRRIVTVHDMIRELFDPLARGAQGVIAAKRAAISRADHIICVSENTRRDLVRLYEIDPARTSVVHLGYSLTTEESSKDIQVDPNRGQRPSLLYVGNRGGYKNFRALLNAYRSSAILQNFDLIAFGGTRLLASERQEINRLGLAERVLFKSGSDRDLQETYRAATAFVYPSMYEGFGIPPLEAMSYGCPVVCSNAGSIPEIVEDAGVYFDPSSSDDLRSALERVALSEELQADLRERGYRRVSAFSWDRCAQETARIYAEMI